MRAVLMRSFGGSDVLRLEEVDDPEPATGEVLVRVGAVEVSRTRDVATRTGRHPFSQQVRLPHVLGGDFAGVVTAVGDGVGRDLLGRRVAVMNSHSCGRCPACRSGSSHECQQLQMLGIHRWGSYADLVSTPADTVHVLPDGIDMAGAAALAATGPIALMQLQTARVGAGTVVLVTGVTGALGSALAALAPTLGARVIGLTRRVGSVPPSLGITVLDAAAQDLTRALVDASGGGVGAAIDNVAGPEVFDRYFPALATGARVVISGAIGSPELPVLRVPAAPLYVRSISVLGVRTATSRATLDFWELVRQGFRLPEGLVHPQPLESAAAAHDAVLSGSASGHTVLRVDPAVV